MHQRDRWGRRHAHRGQSGNPDSATARPEPGRAPPGSGRIGDQVGRRHRSRRDGRSAGTRIGPGRPTRRRWPPVPSCLSQHPHDVAALQQVGLGGSGAAGTDPTPDTNTLAVTQGWSIEQTLILLIALALIALILVPGGLLSRRLDRRKR